MKCARWWLALAYALATLMAQGVHDHGGGADDAVPESRGDCDEARPHLAGHESTPLGQAPATCPSCQFRAQHPLSEMAPGPLPGPSLAIPIEIEPTATLPGSPLRTRCRAPPRV